MSKKEMDDHTEYNEDETLLMAIQWEYKEE